MTIEGPDIPQLRHALRAGLPPWLRRDVGDSFVTEGLFTVYDLDTEFMRDALLARLPSYAPDDALPLIASDRGIPIGANERPEVVRVRLLLWIDILQLQGLPIGLLITLQATLAPFYPLIRIVTQASLWYTLEEGAVGRMLEVQGHAPLPPAPYESGQYWPVGQEASKIERLRFSGLYERLKASPPNWDWDSLSPVRGSGTKHSTWIVVDCSAADAPFEPAPKWGSGVKWGSGLAWGVNASSERGRLLKTTAKRFKPAGCWVRTIILTFDAALFDPAEPSGGGVNPDGLFGRWAKVVNRRYVPARFTDARYSGQVI